MGANFSDLSDDQLMEDLHVICADERRLHAQIVRYLVEVEERRIHLKMACTSLFDFCVRRLAMSEGEAFRRMTAARLARRFPSILPKVESGAIHLSGLVLLRDHLTESNHEELVAEAAGKSKRQIQEIVARLAPKPDVPPTIRKLPDPSTQKPTPAPLPMAAPPMPRPVPSPPTPPMAALSEVRYRVQLTASAELKQKLERATELMGHSNPHGDLAVVIERALDVLIADLEKKRLATTTRPPQKPRSIATRSVPRAVRREVFARDGEQCTFCDKDGQRCPCRARLELDHIHARAHGGSHDAANLRVRCHAHNLLYAEEVFGRDEIMNKIHLRQRKSARDRMKQPAQPS